VLPLLHIAGSGPLAGLGDACRVIYREDGLRGFYRGCATNLLRTTPAAALTFTSFELIARALRRLAAPQQQQQQQLELERQQLQQLDEGEALQADFAARLEQLQEQPAQQQQHVVASPSGLIAHGQQQKEERQQQGQWPWARWPSLHRLRPPGQMAPQPAAGTASEGAGAGDS
jgi:uncharacterized membrane-anchored protein YhcB (DUF1043 family)